MSSCDAKIYAKLSGTSAITAIVGTRIYPSVGTGALPVVVYEQTGGGTINGSSGPTTTNNVQYAITSLASSYSAARTLAEAVKTAMNGWTSATASPAISSCLLRDENGPYQADLDDAGRPVFRVDQDYSLWFA